MESAVRESLRPIRDLLVRWSRVSGTTNNSSAASTTSDQAECIIKSVVKDSEFTYFTSFGELLDWFPTKCLPTQKAAEPLVKRSSEIAHAIRTARVLLIHDYASGYQDYETREPVTLDEPPYTCNYLQFVDTFVYFTHYLVSVPPPTWTDLLHRNGVKVLGTFLIEPQTIGVERVLRYEIIKGPHGESLRVYPVAQKLKEIAETIGFDGWLINIEKAFPPDVWDLELFLGFLQQLKSDHPMIIYYDALTVSNIKSPQNALTPLNRPILQAAGNILLNYHWNPSLVLASLACAEELELDPETLFFGIDVWAQNRPRSFWHPRITWPSNSGGGTNTGFGIRELAQSGVNVGMFAPAWTHQHFDTGAAMANAEKAVWEGVPLSEDAMCGCRPGWFDPKDPHRTAEYQHSPIVRVSREFPAGDKNLFYTNFHPGYEEQADGRYSSALARQSIMPQPILYQSKALSWTVDPSRASLVIQLHPGYSGPSTQANHPIPLYRLNVSILENKVTVRARYCVIRPQFLLSMVLDVASEQHLRGRQSIPLPGKQGDEITFHQNVSIDDNLLRDNQSPNIMAVSIYARNYLPLETTTAVLELYELGIWACHQNHKHETETKVEK